MKPAVGRQPSGDRRTAPGILAAALLLAAGLALVAPLRPGSAKGTAGGGGARFGRWPLAGRVFVVDPGHGGIDGGCSIAGWKEKDLVLPVGLELTRLLRDAGARVGLTRNQDMELGHLLQDGRSRYHRDLSVRVSVARRLGPDLMVSLHANASGNPGMRGAMVFHGVGRADSRRVARRLIEELSRVVPGSQNSALPGDLFVLRQLPQHLAVLVELGFLTNHEDRLVLTSPEGQKNLAKALYDGILRYFTEESASDEPPEPAGRPAAVLPAPLTVCPGHEDP